MRIAALLILLTVTCALGADIVRRKPDAVSPYRLEFIFSRIDSVDGMGIIYGQKISPPLADSNGAYLGRDTAGTAFPVRWELVDTLLDVVLPLDSVQVQGVKLLIAGQVYPRDFPVDSATAAQDSLWLLGR